MKLALFLSLDFLKTSSCLFLSSYLLPSYSARVFFTYTYSHEYTHTCFRLSQCARFFSICQYNFVFLCYSLHSKSPHLKNADSLNCDFETFQIANPNDYCVLFYFRSIQVILRTIGDPHGKQGRRREFCGIWYMT